MKEVSTPFRTDREKHIPNFVVRAIDNILRQKYSSSLDCTISVQEIVDLIPEDKREMAKVDIFYNGWRYYESLYTQRGWNVAYQGPTQEDNYEANFTFKSA